jgi:hypothetical protein
MAVISNLDIVLGAKTDKLDSGLNAGKGKVTGFAAQVKGELGKLASAVPGGDAVMGFASKLGGLGPAAAVAAGGAAVIAAAAAGAAVAIRGVNTQLTEIDSTGDAAKRLGVSFNDLVTARLALGRSSGLEEGAIDSSLQKMQMNLLKARDDGGALNDQLKSLGLDAGQLLQAGPVEALKQVSAAAQGMADPIDQSKLAFDLFGKAGVGLVTSLRDGPEAIDAMQQRAETLGLTLTQAQVEQVGVANDAWEDMTLIATGVFRQIAAEVAPVMTAIVTAVSDVAGGFGGWQTNLPAIVDSIVTMSGYLYDAVEFGNSISKSLINIATLNWDGLKETITNAFSFDTGEKWVAKVQAARDAAAAAAAKPLPPPVDDSTFGAGTGAAAAAQAPAAQAERDRSAERLSALRDEVIEIGMSREAIDRMRLAREGATQAQLNEFDALQRMKEAREKAIEKPPEPDSPKVAEAAKIGALQMGSVEAELAARKNEQGNTVAERGNKLLEQIDAKLGRMAESRGPALRMA